MNDIPRIGTGKCAGCEREDRLLDGACMECRKRHGRKCGLFMERIRRDPRFALMCYKALPGDSQRQRFVDMFGDPRKSAAGQ